MKKILLTIFAAFFFVSPSYTVASQKKKPLKSLLFRIFSKAQKPVETLGESPELKFIKVFRESEDLSLSCIFRRSERLCVPTFLEPKQPFQELMEIRRTKIKDFIKNVPQCTNTSLSKKERRNSRERAHIWATNKESIKDIEGELFKLVSRFSFQVQLTGREIWFHEEKQEDIVFDEKIIGCSRVPLTTESTASGFIASLQEAKTKEDFKVFYLKMSPCFGFSELFELSYQKDTKDFEFERSYDEVLEKTCLLARALLKWARESRYR